MNAAMLFTALALAAPALKDAPKKESTIVGEWVAVSIVVGGKPSDTPALDVRWVFAADGTRTILHDGKEMAKGRFKFDPKSKPPAVDLDPDGPPGSQYPSIYKLEGDTMTLNVGWQNTARPTEFECPAGSKRTLYVFKRAKSKD